MGIFSSTQKKAGFPLVPKDGEGSDGGASPLEGSEQAALGSLAKEKPPRGSAPWEDRLTRAVNFSPAVSEAFRVLRAKILVPPDGRPSPRTILVTSVLPQEGKSFVSANLGVALAQGIDQHALLVDCDLRLPTLSGLLGIEGSGGLSDYLKNTEELPALIRKTSMDKLSILPSGVPPVNPAELLGSTRMNNLVAELSHRYPDRFVVFDCPPLLVASESMTLSQVVDGVVLVVRQGVTSKILLQQAIADIGKERILGVVFNGHRSNPITSRILGRAYYGNYYRRASS